MKIGFIGVGQMGRRMVMRLLKVGYDLTTCDLRKEAAQHLIERGAKWMDTPKGLAESCEVVFSSLPGPSEMEEVVYGANGLMVGWKKGDIYVDMSTNFPPTVQRIAKDAKVKGVAVLDAPVSGGTTGAEAGTLAIMLGGDSSALEQVHRILETIGTKIFHCGDVGSGNIAKLINNLITLTCCAINAEGFVLGVKAGLDPMKLWEIIKVSTGNNFTLEKSFPSTVLQGKFDSGFRMTLACKDIGLALTLGKEYSVPMPIGSAVEQRLIEGKAAGLGEKSPQSIILLLEEMVGVKVRSPK